MYHERAQVARTGAVRARATDKSAAGYRSPPLRATTDPGWQERGPELGDLYR